MNLKSKQCTFSSKNILTRGYYEGAIWKSNLNYDIFRTSANQQQKFDYFINSKIKINDNQTFWTIDNSYLISFQISIFVLNTKKLQAFLSKICNKNAFKGTNYETYISKLFLCVDFHLYIIRTKNVAFLTKNRPKSYFGEKFFLKVNLIIILVNENHVLILNLIKNSINTMRVWWNIYQKIFSLNFFWLLFKFNHKFFDILLKIKVFSNTLLKNLNILTKFELI